MAVDSLSRPGSVVGDSPSRRAADVILSGLGLIVSLPLLVLAAALIAIETPGAPLLLQTRVGRDGRAFRMLKLRTMIRDAEPDDVPVWATTDDPRVTRVGYWLRRSHADELPQLWNVLRGEMSLIGPRPERPEIVDSLRDRYPDYANRLMVRPGITGLAQVSAGYAGNLDDVATKLRFDLTYLERRSLRNDSSILLRTIVLVARLDGT